MPQQRLGSEGGAGDRLGHDDRDLFAAHRVGLVRPAALTRRERRKSVPLSLLEPLVVALAGHTEHSTRLGDVVDLGGILDETDTTVIHNVFVGHGMASCSLDLSNPETASRGPHLHGGWPGQVSPQPVISKV